MNFNSFKLFNKLFSNWITIKSDVNNLLPFIAKLCSFYRNSDRRIETTTCMHTYMWCFACIKVSLNKCMYANAISMPTNERPTNQPTKCASERTSMKELSNKQNKCMCE